MTVQGVQLKGQGRCVDAETGPLKRSFLTRAQGTGPQVVVAQDG